MYTEISENINILKDHQKFPSLFMCNLYSFYASAEAECILLLVSPSVSQSLYFGIISQTTRMISIFFFYMQLLFRIRRVDTKFRFGPKTVTGSSDGLGGAHSQNYYY